jgi:hypothetical protein
MTAGVNDTPSRPILTATSAQLFVRDIRRRGAFFTDKLSFQVEFVYGDPPVYGQVKRDQGRLALRVVC